VSGGRDFFGEKPVPVFDPTFFAGGPVRHSYCIEVGEGEKALLAWFDIEAICDGLRAFDRERQRERRFREIRAELFAELRKKHPERIRRWWNR